MAIRAQAPGGEEWRGDVCYLGQQQGGSPTSLQCNSGPPPVPVQGNSLATLLLQILFHCFKPSKLTPVLISKIRSSRKGG